MFTSKFKFVSENDFNNKIKDFTGVILIKDSSIHDIYVKYLDKLLPENYMVFELNFTDNKLEKVIPLNLGINLYKYVNGDLKDYKNQMLGYVALKEWIEDLK